LSVKKEILLPDIGDFDNVDVAEVLVSAGDRVAAEDSLIVLESDKATMEIPAPFGGVVVEVRVSVGDQISQGALIAVFEVDDDAEEATAPALPSGTERPAAAPIAAPAPEVAAPAPEPAPSEAQTATLPTPDRDESAETTSGATAVGAHASPSVRRLARELGADLRLVSGTGRNGRILAEDVQGYVKSVIAKGTAAGVSIGSGSIAAPVEIDFSQFGPTEVQPLARIRKISAAHLHHSWVTVPHVTQFEEADITELDAFRREMKPEAEQRGVVLTFLSFVLKACAHALGEFPQFNTSLDHTGENLIVKHYYHIGVAVETEGGLVVPVVRDADRKGLYDIATELTDLSTRARARKLRPEDLQGGTFSISNLGGIGGTFFTPIVNHPEVSVLGVGRMQWKPVFEDGEFTPRLILPLSLSYDHRVVDGADAARFVTRLAQLLSDLRQLAL